MKLFLALIVLGAIAAAIFVVSWAGTVGSSGCATFC